MRIHRKNTPVRSEEQVVKYGPAEGVRLVARTDQGDGLRAEHFSDVAHHLTTFTHLAAVPSASQLFCANFPDLPHSLSLQWEKANKLKRATPRFSGRVFMFMITACQHYASGQLLQVNSLILIVSIT